MSALPSRSLESNSIDQLPLAMRLRVVGDDDLDPGLRSGTNEDLNLRTHAAGFVASAVACCVLSYVSALVGDVWQFLSCSAYGVAMMAVYAFSTLSHGRFSPKRRHFFRTLDQVTIFLFIAAATTPFVITFSRDFWGWLLLGSTWALALIGVALKLLVTRLGLVPVWYYLLVGWFPAMSLIRIGPQIGATGVSLLLSSALVFTVGTWFLTNDHKAHWYHSVWHILVIIGMGLQYSTVLLFVLPWG